MKTDPKRLKALVQIAAMMRDVELQKLAQAEQICAVTRARLAALGDVVQPPIADLAQAAVNDLHDLWQFQRRVELNRRLAQQMATKYGQHDIAARSFGRAAVLAKLQSRKN